MTKVITGKLFNTSFGRIIVYNEISMNFSVGETVLFNNEPYLINDIMPPTSPDGRWAVMVSNV